MARTLNATLLTYLQSGGSIYWYVVIEANPNDDWGTGITQIVMGTISTNEFGSETDFWTSKLIDIDQINISGNPFEDSLAKISDMRFTIDNTDGGINATDYLGRKCTIYIGYGTSIDSTHSEIMGTGKIYDAKSSKFDARFIVRGPGDLRNKEVGTVLSETVSEKYRGKIIPKTWGDWTDSDAYAPLVVENAFSELPQMTWDTEEWNDFQKLILYDVNGLSSYEVTDTTQYELGANENELSIIQIADTGATLTGSIGENATTLIVSNGSLIDYYVSSGNDIPIQTVLKIDNELILVYTKHSSGSNIIYVERGYNGTSKAVHLDGSTIYQITDNMTGVTIKLNKQFMGIKYSGMQGIDGPNDASFLRSYKYSGNVSDLDSLTDSVEYLQEMNKGSGGFGNYDNYVYHVLDFNFENIGISGAVISQYILCKCNARMYFKTSSGSADEFASSHILIGKDGVFWEYFVFTVSGVTVSPGTDSIYQNGTSVLRTVSTDITAGAGTVTMRRTRDYSDPAASGTLTLVTGTGDASVTYSQYENTEANEIISQGRTTVGDSNYTFNNINGGFSETLLPVHNSIKIDDISELNSTRYSLFLFGMVSRARDVYAYATVYQAGFRIDFNVSPLKYDFFVRGEGRKQPASGYYTGAGSTLMENPATILEDYLRADSGLGDSDINETAFDSFEASRTDWKLAYSVNSDMMTIEGLY